MTDHVNGPALAAVTGDVRQSSEALMTVFYNGDCRVCRARVARYQALSGARGPVLAWCDVARAPWALKRYRVPTAVALQNVHVVDRSGRLYAGPAAFARLWQVLPGRRWLAHLVGLPGVDGLAQMLYRRVLAPWVHRASPHGRPT